MLILLLIVLNQVTYYSQLWLENCSSVYKIHLLGLYCILALRYNLPEKLVAGDLKVGNMASTISRKEQCDPNFW